jgi:hypothetical protein
MWVYNDDRDRLIPTSRPACLALARTIAEEEGMSEAILELYPQTPFGPVVNVTFQDGKIRCYTLRENAFANYVVDVADGDITYTCWYNHKIGQLELYDPFNPDPELIFGYLDPQGNLIQK